MWSAKTEVENAINVRLIKMIFGVLAVALVGLVSSRPTQAQVTSLTQTPDLTVVIHLPLGGGDMNPCNNFEAITFTGGHDIEINRFSTNGGFHFFVKTTTGGKGVGTSGDSYTVNETEEFGFNVTGAFESTNGNDKHVISQSRTQDFRFHMNLHITVNANGIPTANVDNVSTRCQ